MRIRCKETVQPCRERRARRALTGPLAELDVVAGAGEGAGVCCASFRDISAVVKAPEKEKNQGGGKKKVGAAVLNVEVGEVRERGRGGEWCWCAGCLLGGGGEGEVLGKVGGGEWCWGAGVTR